MAKQAVSRTDQDFGVGSYWRVQQVIERALVLVRSGANDALEFVHVGDEWWQAIIKPTHDRTEPYLVSFRRTNRAVVEVAMRKGEVLRDAR